MPVDNSSAIGQVAIRRCRSAGAECLSNGSAIQNQSSLRNIMSLLAELERLLDATNYKHFAPIGALDLCSMVTGL
jgi:hypothetical protein